MRLPPKMTPVQIAEAQLMARERKRLCWREMPACATSASIGPAGGRGKTGGTGVIVRYGAA